MGKLQPPRGCQGGPRRDAPLLDLLPSTIPQALHARSSLRRLRAARSHMMASYYAAAWAVAGLAVGRAVLLADATPSGVAAGALNALWLVTRLGERDWEGKGGVFCGRVGTRRLQGLLCQDCRKLLP